MICQVLHISPEEQDRMPVGQFMAACDWLDANVLKRD